MASSSALGIGMGSLSHMPISSTMLQPSSLIPNNLVGMDNRQPQMPQITNQDHPNSDMLLALIARNKSLEGKIFFKFIDCCC